MSKGTVKWFNDTRGFGMIRAEGGQDVYVHCGEIQTAGFKSLSQGARVEFECVQGPRGPRAMNVRRLQRQG